MYKSIRTHKTKLKWPFLNQQVGEKISRVTQYFDQVFQLDENDEDDGSLLSFINCTYKTKVPLKGIPNATSDFKQSRVILLNKTLNFHLDLQELFISLRLRLARSSRIVATTYNPYIWKIVSLITAPLGFSDTPPLTFITQTDLINITRLTGFEIVKTQSGIFFPWNLFGLGKLLNQIIPIIPGIHFLALIRISIIRPIIPSEDASLSIIVPARNEQGNIANIIKEISILRMDFEVIFVEGGSSDGTWEEIQKVIALHHSKEERFQIKAVQQVGRGKNDAVRLGFLHASKEVLTILDADLSVDPQMLSRFHLAYCEGMADFINGTRLTYPIEKNAMRPLNLLGNVVFVKALNYILDTRLGDTLCGTKMLSRHDYIRIRQWCKNFGDFDPFGDFELLFPAAVLGLGIIDIPVRYYARIYGKTNISRLTDGFKLLKMTVVGFLKIKLGN